METFSCLPLMQRMPRHWNKERGREEDAREECCFLGNRHCAAQGTGGIRPSERLLNKTYAGKYEIKLNISVARGDFPQPAPNNSKHFKKIFNLFG